MSRAQLPVILDVDGVIADFCGAVDACTRSYDTFPGNWSEWHIESNVPHDVLNGVLAHLRGRGFARSIPELPGAVDAVRRAIMQGIPIVFATTVLGGSPTWAYDRAEWLQKRFGDLEGWDLVQVDTGRTKRHIAGLTLIDDSDRNIHNWQACGDARVYGDKYSEARQGIIVDAPYNLRTTDVIRAADVAEALQIVRGWL